MATDRCEPCDTRDAKSSDAVTELCLVYVDKDGVVVWMCLSCAAYKTSCSLCLNLATGRRGVLTGPGTKKDDALRVSWPILLPSWLTLMVVSGASPSVRQGTSRYCEDSIRSGESWVCRAQKG